ncbi:hypothetical protein GUITHDRAFT_101396 [Guillardia theta CCMP2712]|uniref:Fucosyltransferase n=1 Tax=Guillardia theta (strain CCMP2712) TaxID=905079 RepID=L1JX82_GUITC|nr:hypothetical protein GUITHDRAFT_101396 [Guillardia theta CCMP2712]EKX52944.1 hypothetical protein GUITHDRAFT_101396 [Guillardia theta CCMP2712]|eukprot:XP_005839924.1 hypothetical protein GUITHDRAFT_101396 [Guillardia theta CCMP2712]
MERRPFVVATLIKWFDAQGFDEEEVASCSVPCLFLKLPEYSNEKCVEEADMLLATTNFQPPPSFAKFAPVSFSSASAQGLTGLLPSWQIWGYFSLESAVNYPEMEREEYMKQFEVELSTRMFSDVPMTFAPRDSDVIRRPTAEKKFGFALYLQSNCVSWRDDIVRELMEHVPVDSLGRCLNNGDIPERMTTVELISRYKFFIAFENSIHHDFVTERIFNAWIAGAIPIYKGAPNVDDFAPSPRSFLLLDDFDSVPALAAYLR